MKEKAKVIGSITILLFTITIFAPLEIYLSNVSEFWFSLGQLLANIVVVFGVLELAFVAGCYIIGKINRNALYIAIYALTVLILGLYVEGNFLSVNLRILNGTKVEWSFFDTSSIISLCWWVILILAASFILKNCINKKDRVAGIFIVCACLLCVELVTIVYAFVINCDELKANANIICYATDADEMKLSKKSNYIVLLLDAFDSSYMNDLLESENGAKYSEMLEDFTFYPDTLGSYNRTDTAVPQILTNQGYLNECRFSDYQVGAYSNSPLINKLYSNEYSVGLYSVVSFPQCENITKTANITPANTLQITSKRRFIENVYRLVGYRYLPYMLKQFCWFYPVEEFETLKQDSGGNCTYDESNECFYNLLDNMEVSDESSVFKFYHIRGMHLPFNTTSDCKLSDVEVGVEETLNGNMLLVEKFLNELKTVGVYDDSVIVIMADHGYRLFQDMDYEISTTPLFMIKGIGESHDFRVSDEKLSYMGINDTLCRLMDGQCADEATAKMKEDETRKFYAYAYCIDGIGKVYMEDIYEYEKRASDDVYDTYTLYPTGNVYSFSE